MEQTNRKKKRWILLGISIIVFFTLVFSILTKEKILADTIGYGIISKYIISDSITPIVKTLTQLGGPICLIIATIILVIIIRNKKIKICICANLIISSSINYLIKNILQRPRPEEFKIIEETGYSFPSGHSMLSVAFYGLLIYLIHKNVSNTYLKYGLISILTILILSIGMSRIYLGVHYTSDVIAGFLLGISYLIIFIEIISNRYKI